MDNYAQTVENEPTTNAEEYVSIQLDKIAALEHNHEVLKGRHLMHWGFMVAITTGLISGFFILSNKIDKLSERVSHYEGAHPDALLAALDGLTMPKSPSDLNNTVQKLALQARLDKVNHVTPKEVNVEKLAEALSTAASVDPQQPKIWDAIGSIATFRADGSKKTESDVEPNCDLTSGIRGGLPLASPEDGAAFASLGAGFDQILAMNVARVKGESSLLPARVFWNCRLKLSDLVLVTRTREDDTAALGALYMATSEREMLDRVTKFKDRPRTPVVLAGGTLVYDGGEIPPVVTSIFLNNSRVAFDIQSDPGEKGRKLLLTALQSPDPRSFHVKF